MPPQQAYGLPDLVDDILRFRAHFCFLTTGLIGRRDT
jgi:hypothetical protein